jgi:hypothetical protein
MAERYAEVEADGVGNGEHCPKAVHDRRMECGWHRTDPNGPGSQHHVLDGWDHRVRWSVVEGQSEHDAGDVAHLVGQAGCRMEAGGQIGVFAEAFVVALGPPRLAVEGAELADDVSVGDHEEPCDLLVPSVGCPYGSLDQESEIVEGYWIRPESPDGALCKDRLAQ